MIKTSKDYKVAIIGYGWVGKAYHKMFPDAYLYDVTFPDKIGIDLDGEAHLEHYSHPFVNGLVANKAAINRDCDLALICVPTNPTKVIDVGDGEKFFAIQPEDPEGVYNELDMSIIEDVINWLETPLILCKSALQPGTVDRLVEQTGKKIAVSVEMVGEGRYFVPFWKYPHPEDPSYHSFLIVGGQEETAKACADFLWARMSPDINIHLVSAVEAEICKMFENTWGAMKVTFANVVYDICESMGANYTKVLQAWGADGRTEKMHMRVLPHKRGWRSKCYDKDVPAFADLDKSGFLKSMVKTNRKHLDENSS